MKRRVSLSKLTGELETLLISNHSLASLKLNISLGGVLPSDIK